MSGRNSGDQTVKERRLRPIYEFLDSGNNKRVVQEVDRLLKKQPDFCCGKVLKALALLRMGKIADCLAILDPIVDQIPTDDNTIQAVIICYRELGRPNMVCQLLEKASKIDPSEDLLTNCFMAYVRITDYDKQHQVAMSLYKLYPKTPYFSWAIMSLYVKAEFDSGPSVRVSLPLAERMMKKFLEENKIESEHELWLYALILAKQGNFAKMLELMERYEESKIPTLSQYFKKKKNNCLEMAGQAEALATHMESSITESSDNWSLYSDYVIRFGVCETERVLKFLDQHIKESRPASFPRAVLLAYLLLYKRLAKQRIVPNFDVFIYFEKYVSHFAAKPSFFMDLLDFFSSGPVDELKTKCLAIIQRTIDSSAVDYAKVKDIQTDLNTHYVLRYFDMGKEASAIRLLNIFQTRVSNYLLARDKQLEAGIPWPLKEGPQDDFITVAALDLLDSVWTYSEIWIGIFKCLSLSLEGTWVNRDLSTSTTNNSTLSGTCEDIPSKQGEVEVNVETHNKRSRANGLAGISLDDIKSFQATEEDFPLLISLASLHYGLDKSPTNSQMRLVLVKAYIRCGAIGAAMDVLNGLDLKHVQLESLGYLYLFKLISLAHYEEGLTAFRSLETFYSTFEKESMEHVLAAYKYGSWEKVVEFMNFRKSIQCSAQRALVHVEKRLLELILDVSDHSQLVLIARKAEYDLQSMCLDIFDQLIDSRDLSVLVVLRDQPSLTHWKDVSFAADKKKLKIRALILTLATEAVLVADDLVLDREVKDRVATFEKLLKLLQTELSVDVSGLRLDKVTVDGMWPPRIAQYLTSGCTDLLIDIFSILPSSITLETPLNMADYSTGFRGSLDRMMSSLLRSYSGGTSEVSLTNAACYLETLSESVETLSIVCIVLESIYSILKKRAALSLKSKKKKTSYTVLDPGALASFDEFVSASSQALTNTEARLLEFIGAINVKYPNSWDVMLPFWETKVHQDLLCDILPFSTPIIIAKIRASFSKSATQMSYLIKSKLKMLDSFSER